MQEALAIALAVSRAVSQEERKRQEEQLVRWATNLFEKNPGFIGPLNLVAQRLHLNPTTVGRILNQLIDSKTITCEETPAGDIYRLKTK